MKIEIDTKKDSADDIKKTIEFLLKFVDQSSNIIDSETPTIGEGSFNIFDNPVSNDDNDGNDDDEPVTIVKY